MKRKAVASLLPLVCGLMVLAMQGHAAESVDPRPANLVEWSSGESAERLSRSSHKTDVNPNRAPWVWVRSDDLIAAMRTFDTVENRGYLLVSEVE